MIPWHWLIWVALAGTLLGFLLCAILSAGAISEAKARVEWLRQIYNKQQEDYAALQKLFIGDPLP